MEKLNHLSIRQNDRAAGLKFLICKLGENEHFEQEKTYENPHRHPYFEVIWKTGGTSHCRIDFRHYNMCDDAIYFISPGQIHLLQTGVDASGYVVRFSREFLHLMTGTADNNFYGDMLINPTQFKIKNATEKKEMEEILSCIMREFRNNSTLRPDILSGWLRIFLVYLKNLTTTPEPVSDHPGNINLIQKFYSLLEKEFLKRKMVVDYAEELFVSPGYLNEIVKRASGFTASHHIQQRIVLEAKRLAIYSGSSMKEIAYLLGYDDTAHFSKFFKTYSGTNFSEFKRVRSGCDVS
jgi:AraC-like DNA-binding protein